MYIYIVRPGDTLRHISEMSGVSEQTAAYINQLSLPYKPVPGQALLLPAEAEPVPPPKGTGRAAAVKGYAYPFISREVLEETLPYLTSLCSFSYGFTPEGELIPPPADDRRLIGTAEAEGVRAELTLASAR